jgi:hypothetical protein
MNVTGLNALAAQKCRLFAEVMLPESLQPLAWSLPSARHLVYVREEERYAHAEYPLRGALRTL